MRGLKRLKASLLRRVRLHPLWQMGLLCAGLSGQRFADKWDTARYGKASASQGFEQGAVIGEYPVNGIETERGGIGVKPPPLLVIVEHGQRAYVETGMTAIFEHFDQCGDIFEAKIEPLSCEWVDPPCCISDQCDAGRDHAVGNLQFERIRDGRSIELHLAGKPGKARVKLGFDPVFARCGQGLGCTGFHIPGEVCAVAGQGQGGKGAFGG